MTTGIQESYQKIGQALCRAIFSFFCSSWKDRNEALHGRDQEDSDNIMRTRLLRRIDNIYAVKDKLQVEDSKEICGYPHSQFQECITTALHNYVGYAEAMLPAALRRSTAIPWGQSTMTQFMTTRARVLHLGVPGIT
jgi:hypothetical protein